MLSHFDEEMQVARHESPHVVAESRDRAPDQQSTGTLG